MYRLVPALTAEMGPAYPELVRAQALITETLKLEETRFRETLVRGLKLLDDATTGLSKGDSLAGDVAFKLHDTYGFPLDLTQDALKARGIAGRYHRFRRGDEACTRRGAQGLVRLRRSGRRDAVVRSCTRNSAPANSSVTIRGS